MLESLLLVQMLSPVKGDITFKTSGASVTTITTSDLGHGFTTQYSIDGSPLVKAGTSFSIPAGDHEVTLKLEVTTGTSLNMQPFSSILTEVTDWEGFQLPNIQFRSCAKLTKVPDYLPSVITDTQWMFQGCRSFNQDISRWDTSKVTDMSLMFFGCTSFNQDIGNWDTSKVTNMGFMFRDAIVFNQYIGDWDVSKVTNMGGIFRDCYTFNQDIGNWDMGNVTNMSDMFSGCSSFNRDISRWNVGNVTNMSYMFQGCRSFNQDIRNWNVSNVASMIQMFNNCKSFNQDLSSMVFKSTVRRDDYDTGTTAWNTAYRPKFTG